MNKLTKVGISALAGSLAVVGANASEYSVTGDTQVVYSSAQGNEADAVASNGKGIGVDTDIYFTASGELDNGWTVSFFTAMDMEQSNTATSGGLNSSAQLTIGMGSLGTVQFNDISGSAANAIDDVLPKAYEETWDGTSHSSSFHSFGSSTQSGSVDYRFPALSFGDMSLSLTATYDPNAGSGPASAGGVAANLAIRKNLTKLSEEKKREIDLTNEKDQATSKTSAFWDFWGPIFVKSEIKAFLNFPLKSSSAFFKAAIFSLERFCNTLDVINSSWASTLFKISNSGFGMVSSFAFKKK